MWAGPLCGQLLARAGATVVKVEARGRPDGTRAGPAAFFDWMNSGKLSYAVDFDEPTGLPRLLEAADVVIESSRPAALARRGLGPADIAPRDGRVWLRITGHGTDGERADWVAFGDDAAVSGGLVGGSAERAGVLRRRDRRPVDRPARRAGSRGIAEPRRRRADRAVDGRCRRHLRRTMTAPPKRAAPQRLRRRRQPLGLGADNAAVERLLAERRLAPC